MKSSAEAFRKWCEDARGIKDLPQVDEDRNATEFPYLFARAFNATFAPVDIEGPPKRDMLWLVSSDFFPQVDWRRPDDFYLEDAMDIWWRQKKTLEVAEHDINRIPMVISMVWLYTGDNTGVWQGLLEAKVDGKAYSTSAFDAFPEYCARELVSDIMRDVFCKPYIEMERYIRYTDKE